MVMAVKENFTIFGLFVCLFICFDVLRPSQRILSCRDITSILCEFYPTLGCHDIRNILKLQPLN